MQCSNAVVRGTARALLSHPCSRGMSVLLATLAPRMVLLNQASSALLMILGRARLHAAIMPEERGYVMPAVSLASVLEQGRYPAVSFVAWRFACPGSECCLAELQVL